MIAVDLRYFGQIAFDASFPDGVFSTSVNEYVALVVYRQ